MILDKQETRTAKLLILDTDMGNDIDDALALAMIHTLSSKGECQLLGVTVSKDNPFAAQYVDVVNTFYGAGNIPIGKVSCGVTPLDGEFVRQVVSATKNSVACYKKTFTEDEYEAAVPLLRRLLVKQQDQSVIPVLIGFSTNMAQLLSSPPDAISPLSGKELFARKVSHVVAMAGDFSPSVQANPTLENREYNIHCDIISAMNFFAQCPVPITFCGYEIGSALLFPASSIEMDYSWCEQHPVADAYRLYKAMPYDRPSWDQTAVLAAVRPEYHYFKKSSSGTVEVSQEGIAMFSPEASGLHTVLALPKDLQQQVLEDIIALCSQPVAQCNEL